MLQFISLKRLVLGVILTVGTIASIGGLMLLIEHVIGM